MNETETPRAAPVAAFRSSPEIGELATALAKAQATFPEIERNRDVRVVTKSGKEYTFRYATLDVILRAVRKPLADNGLSVTQPIEEANGRAVLKTVLMHSSGQWLVSETPIPPSMGTQEFGSNLTYMRRYALSGVLNVASQEDDDGNLAEGHVFHEAPRGKMAEAADEAGEPDLEPGTGPGMATQKQLKFIWTLAKKFGWSADDLKRHLATAHKIGASKEMTKAIASEVIEYLQASILNREMAAEDAQEGM